MKKNGHSLKATFQEALENYTKKDLKASEILCYKILSIDPNHFDSINLLSNIFAINNNFEKAKDLLIKANKIQPNNKSVLNNLGTAYKELGDNEKTINYYQKVLEIDPKHTNANYNLGSVYYKLKDLKKAKNYFEKTVEAQPNFAIAYFSLGNVLSELKEFKKAKNYYEKCAEIRPDFPSAHNNLGLVFRELGEPKNAISCYKKTIEINPNHAGAYNNLGRIYTEIGEFDKAIEAHKAATKIEPENLYHYFYLSELNKKFLNSDLKNSVNEILKNKKTTIQNIVFGNFLLSRFEKQDKNYQKEFDHLIKAHDNYFDFKKQKFVLGVKYCFEDLLQISNEAKLETKNKTSDYKIKPIFIVGVPRCGSTLVEKVIGSGKNVVPMGEEVALFENFVNKKILEKQSLNLGKVEDVREELASLYAEKGLIKSECNFIFTDKSLNNFYYLDLIKEIFPQAKIINCVRSTLSSIVSIFQNNLTELAWAHNLDSIFKYFDNYFRMMDKFKKKHGNFIYDLKFDNFTNEPEAESKKLMAFCNLTWDKKCLEFYKRKDIISKTTSYQQIRKSIYKHPASRYLPYKEFLNTYGNKYHWFN